MSERDTYDVIVIGGGIVGMTAAWQLARAGNRRVLVIDKGEVAFEQSSRNWGWIRQNGRNMREVEAAVASRALWDELVACVDGDIGFHSAGNLQLAYDDGDLALFARWREAAASHGLATEALTREQTQNLYPQLRGTFVGANYSPRDAQADPRRAVAALARRLEGTVTIETGTAVHHIDVAADQVTGIVTERGRRSAPVVIVAAGAWSSRLLFTLGIRLPQRKYRSTVFETTPIARVSRIVVWARRVAFRQTETGSCIVAGAGAILDHDFESLRFRRDFEGRDADSSRRDRPRDRYGMALLRDARFLLGARSSFWRDVRAEEPQPDFGAAFATLARFHTLHPAFSGAGIARIWAGNIDYTPDAAPVIERLARPQGLVVATGFSGHGFALGPIGGALAADLAQGLAPRIGIRDFRLSRFAEGDLASGELHF